MVENGTGRNGHASDGTGGRRRLRVRAGMRFEVAERAMVRFWRLGEVGHRAAAFYLADIDQRNLHFQAGYASAVHYAMARLDIPRRTARNLLATGRKLLELPAIDRAFCEGEVSWAKVRMLVGVASPTTEAQWLEEARRLTCRELEEKLRGAEPGRPPRADRLGLPRIRFRVVAELDALTHQKWDLAKRKLAEELGEAEATDSRLVAEALRVFLALEEEGGVPGKRVSRDSLYKIVVHQYPGPGEGVEDRWELDTEEGRVPIPASEAEVLACDGEHVVLQEAPREAEATAKGAANGAPNGVANGHPISSRSASPPTPAWLRAKVLARDGYRCQACGSKRSVQAHHIEERAKGGPTRADNLATLCPRCHALVHDGHLRIEGTPGKDLRLLDREGRQIHRPRGGGGDGDGDGNGLALEVASGGPRGPSAEAAGGGLPLVDEAAVRRAFALLRLDQHGLRPAEQQVLEVLRERGPLSLSSLAAEVGLPCETVSTLLEPPLLRLGLLRITPFGRQAAAAPIRAPDP